MELETLSLTNFRQFVDTDISFAAGQDNVTAIHGQNGSGKTTLLNAFSWILYEEVDFDAQSNYLVNEGKIAEAKPDDQIPVQVELTFQHDGTRYRAMREVAYTKDGRGLDVEMGESTLTLEKQIDSGWLSQPSPKKRIKQIIPDRLRSLFFFDGEDIEELAGVNNQQQIREAIQNIMGLIIMERSISHLDSVADDFEKEYRTHASQEIEEFFEEKDKLKRHIDQKETQLENKKDMRDDVKRRIQEISDILQELDESKDLENDLQNARDRMDTAEKQLDDLNDDLASLLTKDATLAFALPVLQETANDLEEFRQNDLLETDVSPEFFDRILDRRECICGRSLDEPSIYYERVQDLKPEVAVSDLSETMIRLIHAAEHAADDYRDLQGSLITHLERRQEITTKIEDREAEIERLETELSELDVADQPGKKSPAELTAEREQAEQQLEAVNQDIGRLESRLGDIRDDLQEVEREVETAQEEQEQAQVAKRRWLAAEQTKAAIRDQFEKMQDLVRKLANDRVQEMFSSIARKDLEASITDEFELRIESDVGEHSTEVNKSSGETQIASLAFIGSLVAIARERYEQETEAQYFSGGIYPIVMDSPFGALDKEHRRQVAKIIPELGNQVAVFVTDSQWEGPVQEEMEPIAGAQYTLEFDDGAATDDYPETTIVKET